jgi:hypothetical protein
MILSAIFMGTYLIGFVFIMNMRRFKADCSSIVNAFVFMASFIVKFVIQLLILLDTNKFNDPKYALYFGLADYYMNNVVILNLYYFTYTMMSVYDTLEA